MLGFQPNLQGGERISDDPKVGWVAKLNVFRRLVVCVGFSTQPTLAD